MRIPAIVKLQFIVVLWGFTGVMGKLISLNAIPLVWCRLFIATLLIFIYVRFIIKENFNIDKKLILQILGCGVVVGTHWVLFYESIKISNISIATSVLSTGTLFVAFLEPIFFKRKIRLEEIILSLVIIVCMFFIFNTEMSYWKGILLGIGCAFLLALFSIFNGKIYNKANTSVITFYQVFGGLLFVTPLMFLGNNWDSVINIEWLDILWLIILGGVLTSFPMLMTLKLMKHVSPFTVVLSVNLEPVYAIIIAYIIWKDSEKMNPVFYIATAVMILAICINGYLKKQPAREK